MHPEVEKLVFQTQGIPTLPTVYRKLQTTVDDPNCSYDAISAIITSDQGLASRLLRLANSAFYGYPSKVSSILDALCIIGLQQFRQLALATSVMDLFDGIPAQLVSMRDFWSRSIATGIACRLLALERREINSERFFLAGLLSEIGCLLLYQRETERSLQVLEQLKGNEKCWRKAQLEVFGFTSPELGGALLSSWNLPSILVHMVSHVDDPTRSPQNIPDVSLLHVARFLVAALSLGNFGNRRMPEFSEKAWQQCGLEPSALKFLAEKINEQFEDVVGIFLPEVVTVQQPNARAA